MCRYAVPVYRDCVRQHVILSKPCKPYTHGYHSACRFVNSYVISAPSSDAALETHMFSTSRPTSTTSLSCHQVPCCDTAPLFGSRFAVSASTDCTARVWNLLADEAQLTEQHSSAVTRLAVAPGGRTVASVADDEALVWDVATGACLAQIEVCTSFCVSTFIAGFPHDRPEIRLEGFFRIALVHVARCGEYLPLYRQWYHIPLFLAHWAVMRLTVCSLLSYFHCIDKCTDDKSRIQKERCETSPRSSTISHL
jgi:WD40 repeat protein